MQVIRIQEFIPPGYPAYPLGDFLATLNLPFEYTWGAVTADSSWRPADGIPLGPNTRMLYIVQRKVRGADLSVLFPGADPQPDTWVPLWELRSGHWVHFDVPCPSVALQEIPT